MNPVSRLSYNLATLYHLVCAALIILKQDFLGDVVDMSIWMCSDLLLAGVLLTKIGMDPGYVVFIASGMVNSIGLFDCYTVTAALVADYEGAQVCLVPLSLPVPAWVAFSKVVIVRALRIVGLAVCVVPLSLMFLSSRIIFSDIAVGKFLIAIAISSIFSAIFSLFCSTVPKSSATVGRVTTRLLLPLWIFSGTWAGWHTVYETSPWLSALILLNPFMHASELLRSAFFGASAIYRPFWQSAAALVIFMVIFWQWSLIRLKKRLDFV